jgi:hypothetical protein
MPHALAESAAALAFGDELVGLELFADSFDPWLASSTYEPWRTPGGRAFAAA